MKRSLNILCLGLLLGQFALAQDELDLKPQFEQTPAAESQGDSSGATEIWSQPDSRRDSPESPERVQIFSINDKAMANHPPLIPVLPGQKVSLRADVLQFGNACPHPEGCPEGRAAEEFIWTADNGREQSDFETQGTEKVFHIPGDMTADITLRVSHQTLSSSDTIVLHNARLPYYANSPRTMPTTPLGYYPDQSQTTPVYPTLAPSGINQPYWGPYYPYAYGWRPYPYYYYGTVWSGWSGPGWTIGFGWGVVRPGWWAWHPWGYGWYGPRYYGAWYPHAAPLPYRGSALAPRPAYWNRPAVGMRPFRRGRFR